MIAASRPLPSFARYGGSLAFVLALHAIAIVLALNWSSASSPPPAPPPAMMMELAPLPEPEPVPPPPVVQPPRPVEEPPMPKVVEAPKPVIEVPKPKPKPKPQPKPQPKPEPAKEIPVEQPAPAPAAAPAKAPPAPPQPPAPPVSQAPKWESEVMGRLGRFKEYPPQARSRGTEGQVVVAFTLDSQGRVLDASVVSSSGSSLLDRAALRAVNRAQPLPAPPAERLVNGTVNLRAPFTFNLTRDR
ncbi:energy transducer TonB family protein [Pseudomonas sp. DC3000-4b1]|uniref:energy transducer TonB family protein n=1 Tax=unclassified Pseudomonas TaxID=196821 RepID=UPI003CEBBC13